MPASDAPTPALNDTATAVLVLADGSAASLAGCAPHARDSGLKSRKRTVFGGRGTIRRIIFLAAMSARRYEPALKAFFEKLVANGKPKMVALTALMYKIVIIANAKLRSNTMQTTW